MKGVIDLSCQGNLRRRVKLTWVVDGIGEVCGENQQWIHLIMLTLKNTL